MEISKQMEERLGVIEEKEKRWLEIEEKMKNCAAQAKTKIKLDIGGKIFSTSKSTLLAFEGSYFHAMLSSGHWHPDEDGVYFIDRNPKYFNIILDYMRTGKIDVTDLNSKELDKLQDDLDYFQIKLPSPVLPSIPSKILDINMETILLSMFPPGGRRTFRLVHDSSKGTAASDFDNAVKGLSPTLIVIKSTTHYVFGAYVQDRWGQGNGWIGGSKDTFLFTFGNNSTPVKLLHSGNGNGIHISSCGLHLGSDLVAFCSHSCNPQVYTTVAPGYNAVVNNTLLAGSPNWKPLVMEVFAVDIGTK